MKTCRTCGEAKLESEFHRDRRRPDGRTSYCKPCNGARTAAWKSANRDRARESQRVRYLRDRDRYRAEGKAQHLKRKYGITLEQWNAALASQGGRCAICLASEPGGRANEWHVDHDHRTGRVRGILCNGCNIGLGCFRDDASALARASAYIGAHAVAGAV